MKPADKCHRFVYWSEEDGCHIGACPDLCGPCCHGDDPNEVFRELGQIVEEHIQLIEQDGSPLPPSRTRPMQELSLV